ncbi:MAG: ornithine carbamoyltransferase [Alphaproteobacteria bacterium]|nr:ornithine carbamoyltransferase [Alphaproteobacteria bacterium]
MLSANRSEALALAENNFHKHADQKPRSFLSVTDLDAEETKEIINNGLEMKRAPDNFRNVLKGKALALLFQKTSTRTRCSFERAAGELGASANYIDWRTSNFMLADLCDEAKVLSRYYDMIVARLNDHRMFEVMAASSEVSVINGMCNLMHPCQALSDYMTMAEYFGANLKGLRVTYIGDGNNVCRSLAHGAINLGVHLTLCGPEGYKLDEETMRAGRKCVSYVNHPVDAVRDADVIYTDTWISIGSESETAKRLNDFAFYQVNKELVATAPAHALIMHCLPAHPGQEITADVLRSARSVVFDQAENRMHAQKALLRWLAEEDA